MRERHGERTRSVHLIFLVIITLTVIGISGVAIVLDWEWWVLPFMGFGTVFSWILHIRKRFTERTRLFFYAFLFFALIVYHGVHETSFYDLAAVAAIEFAVLAQTDEPKLLDVGLFIFWFCALVSGYRVVTAPGFELTPLIVSRLFLHISVAMTTYLVAHDIIRKRRQGREEDREIIEELKESRRRTSRFLVNVSHAFRPPVNIVNGIAAVLYGRETDRETRRDALRIMDAGRQMSGQIEDLLDYTELETGQFEVSREPYMIASVLNDVLTKLGLYLHEVRPQVVLDVDADVPAMLRGDARRIRKVLYHLLDNAIRYTPKGGVYLRVYAMREAYGVNLCFEIRDTGRGMSRSELAAVREGIYRHGEQKPGGFGLGLQIVFGIVHAMEGFVRMESLPGKGTTVHVSVPQEVVDAARCMEVVNRERLKVAFYQQPGKFEVPVLREYYTQMIMHIIKDFGLNLERTGSLEDLKALLEKDAYTHLFIADEEYAQDPAYFDGLSLRMHVITVAKLSFAPSEGSRVTVLRKPLYAFPLVEVLNAETEEQAKAALSRVEDVRFDGVRALVVDDEQLNLVVARNLLQSLGMETDSALSGEQAVEMARHGRYDIIFMDHMMPGTDGVESAGKIRDILLSEGRKTALVALTANAGSGAREMFAEAGFDGFIAKPVETGELIRVCRKVLQGQEAGR